MLEVHLGDQAPGCLFQDSLNLVASDEQIFKVYVLDLLRIECVKDGLVAYRHAISLAWILPEMVSYSLVFCVDRGKPRIRKKVLNRSLAFEHARNLRPCKPKSWGRLGA
ncbi:hypothetical protein NC653_036818 [Populus alba x Populus x berolinensis]|uniref:Uncharacterized protein n=1 Tax=Populus alba x Populus x berolinensis TaxID=444605 RepID=A0AAD6PVD8_9ROSI|nr:hypothetical protein NC653_036818 [Populus alba x Populus x berolinensis]